MKQTNKTKLVSGTQHGLASSGIQTGGQTLQKMLLRHSLTMVEPWQLTFVLAGTTIRKYDLLFQGQLLGDMADCLVQDCPHHPRVMPKVI